MAVYPVHGIYSKNHEEFESCLNTYITTEKIYCVASETNV